MSNNLTIVDALLLIESLDSPKAVDYSEITISKDNENSPLSEMTAAIAKSNSERNYYGKTEYSKAFDSIDSMMMDYFDKVK